MLEGEVQPGLASSGDTTPLENSSRHPTVSLSQISRRSECRFRRCRSVWHRADLRRRSWRPRRLQVHISDAPDLRVGQRRRMPPSEPSNFAKESAPDLMRPSSGGRHSLTFPRSGQVRVRSRPYRATNSPSSSMSATGASPGPPYPSTDRAGQHSLGRPKRSRSEYRGLCRPQTRGPRPARGPMPP